MEKKSEKPLYYVMLGMFVLVLSGFLTATYVGMAERKGDKLAPGFGFRTGAPEAASAESEGFAASVKKGGRAIAAGFAGAVDSFLPWFGNKPASSPSTASAHRQAAAGAEERDPFEEYYERNYSGKSAGSSSYDSDSGFSGSWSGGSSASQGASGWQKPPSGAEAATSLNEAAAVAKNYSVPRGASASAGNPLFGGPLGKAGNRPAPLQASLPSGKLPPYMSGATAPRGGQPAAGNNSSAKGGALSGMKGGANAGDLNGASENARSGSQGSYNSQMAAGASSVAAAAGGKAAPVAAKPENVSGGDSSSGDTGSADSGSSSGSSAGTDSSSDSSAAVDKPETPEAKAAPVAEDVPGEKSADSFLVASAPGLLQSVVTEQRNGESEQFVTDEDRTAKIDETVLLGEDAPAAGGEKSFSLDLSAAPEAKDPKDLSRLSPERKKELKAKVHAFLQRFGNRFGPISKENTTYTSCDRDPIFCKDNKVTNGYIKATTDNRVTLWLGLKYSEKKFKWRPYAIKTDPPEILEAIRNRHSKRGGSSDSAEGGK